MPDTHSAIQYSLHDSQLASQLMLCNLQTKTQTVNLLGL